MSEKTSKKTSGKESGKLVLGIVPGEYVQIGEDIKVYVTKHKTKSNNKSSLKLSVIAPKDVKILRGEIVERELTALG